MADKSAELRSLVGEAAERGIVVEFVPESQLHDYAAMNWVVGRAWGVPIPDNHIWVSERYRSPGLSLSRTRLESLRHELDEVYMIQRGIEYWPAHVASLKKQEKRKVKMPRAVRRSRQAAMQGMRR